MCLSYKMPFNPTWFRLLARLATFVLEWIFRSLATIILVDVLTNIKIIIVKTLTNIMFGKRRLFQKNKKKALKAKKKKNDNKVSFVR